MNSPAMGVNIPLFCVILRIFGIRCFSLSSKNRGEGGEEQCENGLHEAKVAYGEPAVVGSRGRRKKNRGPISVRLDKLHPKGAVGLDARGRSWRVWAAPVGATVKAWPCRKTHRPSHPEHTGGCQYQEMFLLSQGHEKQKMIENMVGRIISSWNRVGPWLNQVDGLRALVVQV